MNRVALALMNNVDTIFLSYFALFAVGSYAWVRTERRALEVGLYVLSIVLMPLVYLAMFDWDPTGAAIFAPQWIGLTIVALCSAWSLLRRNPMVIVAIALSFLINAVGYLWTRGLLFSSSTVG
jgi:hypothetical protein